MRKAKFVDRCKDVNGEITVPCDSIHFLKTLTYDVEFSGSEIKYHSATVIDENMNDQVDEDGYNTQIMDLIIDYKKDVNVVNKADMCLCTKSTQQYLLHTTS